MNRYNWVLVTLIFSLLMIGYTYCLDILQALQIHFRQDPFNFTTLDYNLMYFFTFLPIFLFNIPLGTILDRRPIAQSLMTLMIMSFVSQVGMTLLVQYRISGYLPLLYVMRAFFGLAGEGAFTVLAVLVTLYAGDNFQTVISLVFSVPFLFDSINSLVTTRMYQSSGGMLLPWSIGCLVCFFSFLSGLLVLKLYVYHKPTQQSPKENQTAIAAYATRRTKVKTPLIQGQKLQIQQNTSKSQKLIAHQQEKKDQQKIEQADPHATQQFSLTQLKSFSWQLWVVVIATFFTQTTLGAFFDNLNELLIQRFNISYTDAGLIIIIPFSALTIFSIIFSYVVNIWPKARRIGYTISTGLHLCGYLVLYLIPNTTEPTQKQYLVAIFFCITMSLNLSMFYSGLFGGVALLVDPKAVGTAYGVAGSAIALACCLGPLVNAVMIDSDPDLPTAYTNYNFCYMLIAIVPFCFGLFIQFGPFQAFDRKYAQVQGKK